MHGCGGLKGHPALCGWCISPVQRGKYVKRRGQSTTFNTTMHVLHIARRFDVNRGEPSPHCRTPCIHPQHAHMHAAKGQGILEGMHGLSYTLNSCQGKTPVLQGKGSKRVKKIASLRFPHYSHDAMDIMHVGWSNFDWTTMQHECMRRTHFASSMLLGECTLTSSGTIIQQLTHRIVLKQLP